MSLAPTMDHNARSSVTVAVGKSKATLNLPAWQAQELPHAKRTLVTWQPQTAVSASNFGGAYVEYLINPNDIDTIQELWLQVGLGAASQTGGSSLYFSSDLSFMIKQVDLVSNGSSETLFSLQGAGLVSYIKNVLTLPYDDRVLLFNNNANGSSSTRTTLAASAGMYLLPIFVPPLTLGAKNGGFLNAASAGWRVRIYFDSLGNWLYANGTAPSVALNSATLLGVGKNIVDQAAKSRSVVAIKKSPAQIKYPVFNSMLTYALASGSTTYNVTLSSIVGPAAFLWFTVRTASNVTTSYSALPDTFTSIASVQLVTASGTNILPQGFTHAYMVGPQAMTLWTGDLTDNNHTSPMSIYCIPFASDVESFIKNGQYDGHYTFTGTEQLQITFTSSLGSASVLDVVAGVQALAQQDPATGIVRRIQ